MTRSLHILSATNVFTRMTSPAAKTLGRAPMTAHRAALRFESNPDALATRCALL